MTTKKSMNRVLLKVLTGCTFAWLSGSVANAVQVTDKVDDCFEACRDQQNLAIEACERLNDDDTLEWEAACVACGGDKNFLGYCMPERFPWYNNSGDRNAWPTCMDRKYRKCLRIAIEDYRACAQACRGSGQTSQNFEQ